MYDFTDALWHYRYPLPPSAWRLHGRILAYAAIGDHLWSER